MRLRHSFPIATFVAAFLAVPALAVSAAPIPPDGIRYLALVNRAHDSIDRLEVSEPGRGEFQEVALGEAVRGGGDSSTVELRGAGCRYDVRFTFRTGQRMVYENVDVCGLQALRVQRPPRDQLDLRHATTP